MATILQTDAKNNGVKESISINELFTRILEIVKSLKKIRQCTPGLIDSGVFLWAISGIYNEYNDQLTIQQRAKFFNLTSEYPRSKIIEQKSISNYINVCGFFDSCFICC